MTSNQPFDQVAPVGNAEPWAQPRLYKYVSLDRALKILQTGEIRR